MPASIAEIETARADYAARAKTWRAEAKLARTHPADVVVFTQRALDDSALAVRFVKFNFTGTLPPPPWPAGPELVAARDRVQAHRDAAEVIARRAPAATFKDAVRVAAAIERDGGALYTQTADMLDRYAAAPKMPDVLKLLPDPRDFFAGIPVYLFALGFLWFALHDSDRGRAHAS